MEESSTPDKVVKSAYLKQATMIGPMLHIKSRNFNGMSSEMHGILLSEIAGYSYMVQKAVGGNPTSKRLFIIIKSGAHIEVDNSFPDASPQGLMTTLAANKIPQLGEMTDVTN